MFFVPILVLINQVDIKLAVVISVFIIVICLGYRFLTALKKKNSKKPNRPIIDY